MVNDVEQMGTHGMSPIAGSKITDTLKHRWYTMIRWGNRDMNQFSKSIHCRL